MAAAENFVGKCFSMFMLLSCLSLTVMGQSLNDTLDEVKVIEKRKQVLSGDERILNFSPGQTIHVVDSATLQEYKAQNIAQLLSQQTPVFIKAYGFNGLATLNFRGSSAAQSQVLWNGVPITNAALGIADVSLLPVGMIHDLRIAYGSAASLLGSGNVGGALLLGSAPPVFVASMRTEVFTSAGSFRQYTAGGKFAWSNQKFSFTANMLGQSAANNFFYKDFYGMRRRTGNAALKGAAAMTDIAWRPAEKDVFRLSAWYQKYDRKIPAALFESSSVKKRADAAIRLLLEWNRKTPEVHCYLRSSFIQDDMSYEDAAVQLFSEATSSQIYTEAGWSFSRNQQHRLLFFVPVQVSWMRDARALHQQEKYAAVAAYTFKSKNKRLTLSASTRAESVNGTGFLLPGVNGSYFVLPFLKLRANLQRTYRVPSLNELYFSPGGNAALKPEQGWSQEVGYRFEKKLSGNLTVIQDLGFYHRRINDWIYWLGGAIWTPHNIASVRSRGAETENILKYSLGNWQLHFGVNASYTVATTVSSYLPGDGSISKQIPYTPVFNGVGSIGFVFRDVSFSYHHVYTGSRYVTVDESEELPAYHTANIQMSYLLPFREQRSLRFSVQLNNLFNADYQVVSYRPMPGFNWLLGICWSNF